MYNNIIINTFTTIANSLYFVYNWIKSHHYQNNAIMIIRIPPESFDILKEAIILILERKYVSSTENYTKTLYQSYLEHMKKLSRSDTITIKQQDEQEDQVVHKSNPNKEEGGKEIDMIEPLPTLLNTSEILADLSNNNSIQVEEVITDEEEEEISADCRSPHRRTILSDDNLSIISISSTSSSLSLISSSSSTGD